MGKKAFGSGEFSGLPSQPVQPDPGGIRTLAVGGCELPNNLVLAPMAGVSNLPFRLIAREAGAALAFTETVSAKALVQGGAKTRRLLDSSPAEAPVAFQLFGADPGVLAEASRILAAEHGAAWIDLNLGCPVKKFIRNGAGSALLSEPDRVREITAAMRAAIDGVFSVKIRTGWDADSINAPEIAQIVAGEGADLLTVHGRTRAQQYTGDADRATIARVVDAAPGLPVLANGDITVPGHVFDVLRETGAAGVMIGRGAMGNPWIFAQTLTLARGDAVSRPTPAERRATIDRHIDLMTASFSDRRLLAANLKKYLAAYAKGQRGSADFRRSVLQCDDLDTILAYADEFFDVPEAA
jgi:tRNA-dihydrouridine synthase B